MIFKKTHKIQKFVIFITIFLFLKLFATAQISYPTVYFTNVYQGDSTANYATNTNSIKVVKLLTGSDFRFVGQVAGATFTATSGNNVNGSLRYTDLNGNPFVLNGTISRQDKNGSTIQSYYFYANTTHAYLFILPTFESSYNSSTTYSTSSDFSVSNINNTLANQATLTSTFLSTCLNSGGPTLTAKITGTISKYEWYSNTNNAASTASPAVLVATHNTNANIDTYLPPTTAVGTLYYFAKITISGGVVYTNTQGITINALPVISSHPSISSQSICQNGISTSLSITASAGSGTGPTYQWYRNATNSNTGGTLIVGATNASFSPPTTTVANTYYYCVVTNSNGCSVISNPSGQITINSNTLLGGTIAGSAEVCSGVNSSSLTLSGYTEGSSILRWESSTSSDFSGVVNTIINTTASYTATNLTSTTYFRAILSNGGCVFQSTSSSVIVNPNTSISVQPTTLSQTYCQNATPTVLSVTAIGGGLTYQWYSNTSNNNTSGSIISGATSSTYSPPTNTANTRYYYVIVSGSCGLSVKSNVSGAIVITTLSATLTITSGSTITCGGSSNLSIAFIGTSPWDISYTNGTNTTNQYSIASSPYTFSVSPQTTTTYSLTSLIDGNFCQSTPNSSVTINVNPPPPPTISASGATTFCNGGSVTLTSSTGTSYLWSNGATTQSIIVNTAGEYTVTVSNSGCSSTSSATVITVNTIPTVASTTPLARCDAGAVVLGASPSAGDIKWYSASTGGSILQTGTSYTTPSINTSTTYYVDATNNGCTTGTRTAVIATVNTTPTVAIGSIPDVNTTSTSFNIPYIINSGSPTYYSIETGVPSLPGFSTISYTTPIPSTPISVTIPPSLANIYSFTIHFKANSCISSYNFTLNVIDLSKGISTITVTGLTSFTYTGSAQGPSTNTKTGSTGIVTYSYSGTGGTSYGPSATAPTVPGTYQVIASLASDANFNAAVSSAYGFTILQAVDPPIVNNATYIYNQAGIPNNIAGLIKSSPIGTIPVWYNSVTSSYSSTPAKMPTQIGFYVFQLKALDTITMLYSEYYSMDTVIIKPPIPFVFDSTFVIGVSTNPLNVGVQVSGLQTALFNYFYLGNKLNTVPILGSVAQIKKYTVSQTINDIESDTASFKTTILDPNSIIHLQKIVDSGELQSNSTFNYGFTFIVSNLTKYPITNIVISDDLRSSVPINSDFNIVKNKATGGLISNQQYDSYNDLNLTKNSSTILPLTKDSANFIMNLIPKGYTGTLSNIAYIKADTKWGTILMQSSAETKEKESYKMPTLYFVDDLNISIPEGYSPNHDGVNDYFVIIKPFNINLDLEVYNRWGNNVYSNKNYKNDWNGKGTKNYAGQELVNGGYYYTLRATDPTGKIQIFKGFIIIQR